MEKNENIYGKGAFAFKISGKRRRLSCQSGGAFTALAGELIRQNWIVYGAAYEKPCAVYRRVTSLQGLDSLKGSKYVQARLNCFPELEADLAGGRKVLFSGTPCYVAAVLNYCRVKRIRTDELLTVELLCHGVPSPRLFQFWLEYTEEKEGIHSRDFIFRDKRADGWGGRYSNFVLSKFRGRLSESWMDIFRSDSYLRESCYHCRFAGAGRNADITMGDFWNIKTAGSFGDANGVSVILFHSEKAMPFLELFRISGELRETDPECATQEPLHHPAPHRDDGVRTCSDNSFEENAKLIAAHYYKPCIPVFLGIPLTLKTEFWKRHILFKAKGSSMVSALKKVMKHE